MYKGHRSFLLLVLQLHLVTHVHSKCYELQEDKKQFIKYDTELDFTERLVCIIYRVRVMMFSATFNNISFISWQSVLLMEETGSGVP